MVSIVYFFKIFMYYVYYLVVVFFKVGSKIFGVKLKVLFKVVFKVVIIVVSKLFIVLKVLKVRVFSVGL